ncbi:unnamed protein product [Somion occarium]|uniref:C2H2-type domain-containing protein n=1 Tax=Somion occarium TaxID=3059160 RepID=A0ABP1CK27_9APHY
MAASTSIIVLRKRKRAEKNHDNLVLHLSSSPSPSYDPFSASESEFEVEKYPFASSSTADVQRKRRKQYACTLEGCNKIYSKPSRLAEHQRSHTGDRPFICAVCDKRYLRESHLQAHSRSHLPSSAKPFVCEEAECGKRFWTAQHLHVHSELHKGEKPYQCNEPGCGLAFAKHHQLRDHMCSVHAPPGTKPYRCEHSGCAKSFSTSQKLRAHLKTHDEKRYTCIQDSCLASQPFFATWTALQHHMRTAHPPTCPHPECNGKVFTAQKGLRAHLRIHEQQNVETELCAAEPQSDAETDNERPRKRRRGGEVGRDWLCDVPGCGKDFKSKKALTTHNNISHLGRRDFRHLAKLHPTEVAAVLVDPVTEDVEDHVETSDAFDIDDITGVTYGVRAKERMQSTRALQCPHPDLQPFLGSIHQALPAGNAKCEYVFSRAYDLRRHLRAIHCLDVEKEIVDEWVRAARNAKAST